MLQRSKMVALRFLRSGFCKKKNNKPPQSKPQTTEEDEAKVNLEEYQDIIDANETLKNWVSPPKIDWLNAPIPTQASFWPPTTGSIDFKTLLASGQLETRLLELASKSGS